MPNGAQAMLATLVKAGVEVCFTNPGTSEMHFVAALDDEPGMRAVLTLFEGVATGAADGYARMAGKPAATLLHLGCGLGNGLANLHNARKARTPVVNIVGDHATYHVAYDAQLQSDIVTVARNVSTWVRSATTTAGLGQDVVEAVSTAMGPPGQVATLIVPADVSWSDGGQVLPPLPPRPPTPVPAAQIDALAEVCRGKARTVMLLGGRALRGEALTLAARIAAQHNITLLAEVFPARIERGAGLPHVERLAYFAEMASVQLHGVRHLILVDAKAPVSFFAYPGKKSYLVPDSCLVHELAVADQDVVAALIALAQRLGAEATPPCLQEAVRPELPTGPLSAEKVCKAVGHLLPPEAIIVDEAQTAGVTLPMHTAGAAAHDVLTLTGGAIGQGLPVAVGAAIACPERPVLALIGDGSAMYTVQSLWTLAREHLSVTVVILNNRSYAILNVELQRVGARAGDGANGGAKARAQLDLQHPAIDFVQLGQSMGIDSVRCSTAEDFNQALQRCLSQHGPHLIEALIPNDLSGMKLRLLPHLLRSLKHLPQPVARLVKSKVAP